jgi:Chaperone of endosialidase
MKNFLKISTILSFVLCGIVDEAFAQKSTGINNTNPSTNAALDVKETNTYPQGILIPRLPGSDSTIIKGRITAADKGLMFFDNISNVFQYWNGTKWMSLGGSAGSTPSSWSLLGNAGTKGQTNFLGTTDTASLRFRTDNKEVMQINKDGKVGIGMKPTGTYILEINGNLKTAGITETSDIRWKKDVRTLSNSLEKVGQLRGVSYNWRKDEFPDKKFDDKEQIGLIAQEVEKIYPQLVDTDALGFKSVQYSKVVALLIEALKEQQGEINSLKAEVSKMSALEGKINALTALVEILAKQNPVVEARK